MGSVCLCTVYLLFDAQLVLTSVCSSSVHLSVLCIHLKWINGVRATVHTHAAPTLFCFNPQEQLTVVSLLSSLFRKEPTVFFLFVFFLVVFVKVCDGKHSDQTVLNNLPGLITVERERGVDRGRKKRGWGGVSEGV